MVREKNIGLIETIQKVCSLDLVKLAIITAESVLISVKGQKVPCVVLIGRDEHGVRRKWRTKYWPYFYILESDFIRLTDNKEVNFDLHVKETLGTGVRSLNRKALTKLVLYSGNDITSFTRFLIKYFKLIGEDPIFTYEADLSKAELLALRYMIDKGIKSGVDIREDGTIIPIELNCRLRKWFLDFESYKVRMCSSGPKKDVPLTMCTWYDNYEDTLYTYYVVNPKWEKLPVFKARYKNHIIKGFVSEGLFLDAIKDKVVQLDPDLFTAWNLDRYDVVKWFQRMKACNLDPALLSPFKSLSWKRKPYKIKGRILFDLMKAYKKFTNAELDSYSLAFMIGEEKFKLEKVLFKGSPAETWDKYPQVVFKRNVNDVLVLKQLDEKYELIEMFNDLRIEFGALFHETLIPHRIIDTALMRFVNKRIALSTSRKGKVDKSKFLGAVVIEPIPGKYKYVGQFDFSREYPNIIKALNISPETYRRPDFKGNCYTVKYKDTIYKFIKKPLGLLPQLINSFFKKRDNYEKKYKAAIKTDVTAKIKMFWRRIFNVKQITNAIYGVMDYPSFRLHRKECSAATAVVGRISIEKLQKIAAKHNRKIIYGDTDSIFVLLEGNTPEEALEDGEKLAQIFNDELSKYFTAEYNIPKAPSNLGLQKIYSKFLLMAKKLYAGKGIWDEKKGWKEYYDFKGIGIVRSDTSIMEKKVLKMLIKMVLSDKPTKELKEYWAKITKDFWNKIYTPFEIAYPLQIKKPIRYYGGKDKNGKPKTLPSHVRSALTSNKLLNTDFTAGDKPRRLPIISKERIEVNVGRKTRTFLIKNISIAEDMVLPDKYILQVDWKRIYKRLAKKVTTIFELVTIQTSMEAYS